MPHVTVIGAGIAGLAATLRLLERGFHVTLLEQDDFLGGKLGAHRHEGAGDFHEHSYHMYLNWYHNFWRIIDEIGAREHFEPEHTTSYLRRGGGAWLPRVVRNTDVGAPGTAYGNIMSGLRSPPDMFLYAYCLADLLGTPVWRHDALDRKSVFAFMNSRRYLTDAAMGVQSDMLLKAFACPSFLTAAGSFRRFISYSYRCPSPMMWLLRGNTQDRLFEPLERHLRRIAADVGTEGRLEIRRLHQVNRLRLTDSGVVDRIDGVELAASPSVDRGRHKPVKTFEIAATGDVILAIPPQAVAPLIDEPVFRHAPLLAAVRKLRSEPMISVDLYFKRKFELPGGVVNLLGSRFALSFLDTSRLWMDNRNAPTFINVVASDARPICDFTPDAIRSLLIEELMEYLPFTAADLDLVRSHVQTNTGEALFTNEVGSWELRPGTTCAIPNLFLAGDYCRNPIDVVTIEGAVASGLLAAEAIRSRARIGEPIEIIQPKPAPEWILAALKLAGEPYAYAAKAVSTTEHWLRRSYREMFPNG